MILFFQIYFLLLEKDDYTPPEYGELSEYTDSAHTEVGALSSRYTKGSDVHDRQSVWNGTVANKLHSVKPVLGDWQPSYMQCRKDEVVLYNLSTVCILTLRHILVCAIILLKCFLKKWKDVNW